MIKRNVHLRTLISTYNNIFIRLNVLITYDKFEIGAITDSASDILRHLKFEKVKQRSVNHDLFSTKLNDK